MNFLTTSMPALSSFRARMYSWVKSLSLGHFPKSCRDNRGRVMEARLAAGEGRHTPALTPLMTPMVRMGPGAGCTFPPHGSAGQAEVKSRSVLCWTLSGRRSVWSLVTLGNYKFFGASHLHL